MRAIIIGLVLGFSVLGFAGQNTDRGRDVPILVELFTSEGCSTCPSADAWLQYLDSTQPVPGAQLIVLSEHVDYWNRDDWKDPFSSAAFSNRQSAYVRALGLKTEFTPQIVVNGTVDLKREDEQTVIQVFDQAARSPRVPVRITSTNLDVGKPSVLRATVEVEGAGADRNATVYEVVALSHAESQVQRGENKGKHLKHVAVVQSLTKIGKLEKGKRFVRETEVALTPGTDPRNIRLIVFVQESGQGKIVGATQQVSMQ
jgi:hypothetical protein